MSGHSLPPTECARMLETRVRFALRCAPPVVFALLLCALAAPLGAATRGPRPTDPDPRAMPSYGRDIRPLLSDRCFRCHGPDPGERRADLRLDTFEEAVRERDGIRAIVPGSPDESELWLRLTHADEDERMPPASSHKAAFDAAELELVRRWIEAGAQYQPHWAFVAPVQPAPPVATSAESSPATPIDAFLQASIDAAGIPVAPPADRATLLRRAFLGLTGLPPTLEELDAFLADDAPGAYERCVDRLLYEEPYATRFAEHFASTWLDAARFADTSGIHTDAGRQMWAWRDWVLRALRDGMPFDQFLTEQMAGDLLPNASLDQQTASGFHRNHVTTDEGGAIPEEYLVEYAVDRASTTSTVFLGLTMGCARCHDHKFDPILQEEFYSFYAFFNSVDEPGLYSQLPDPERAFEPALDLPTEEQAGKLAELRARLEAAEAELATPIPGEEAERAEFFDTLLAGKGLEWWPLSVNEAHSNAGATLSILSDGSVLASGLNPDRDEHLQVLTTEGTQLRLLALEALPDPSLYEGRVGRAANGNAVLGAVRAVAVSIQDPTRRQELNFNWAWADVEQSNGDYRVVNALRGDDGGLGWAVAGHERQGGRAALLLSDAPFGYPGGTRLEVTLDYDSVYARHVLGRVRLSVGSLAEEGLDLLGAAASGWYATAPFKAPSAEAAYATDFGPESLSDLDTERDFDGLTFNYVATFRDDRLNTEFGGGIGPTYVAKRFYVPSARSLEVSLGSDDGYGLFLDGLEVARNEVNRGVGFDQDREVLEVEAGTHFALLKVVNTGGQGGYSWRTLRRENELSGPLLAALLPEHARTAERDAALREAWLDELSPTHRARKAEIAEYQREIAELREAVPETMVMRELEMPRETFVLERGLYDHPNPARPVQRGVPAALGALDPAAPRDRLGLARWMTAPDNPLVARVAVNRLWAFVFGAGLVATPDDFGLQGAWPSHPELLDWLAVEYRASGWDTKAMLHRLVTTDAFRRSVRRSPESAAADPQNHLLAHFPRRRLSAEAIRDQALFVSGMLVESFGGPSVKPLQPEGLWSEVSMLASNTRNYEAGAGDDLWRRSVYTYWKRACPPPSMLIFDAPTREFCTVQRTLTASPLQALVLWNDATFVAAARALADRTLAEDGDDGERLTRMLRRCTGRVPEPEELAALADALRDFRGHFGEHPANAAELVQPAAPAADAEMQAAASPEAPQPESPLEPPHDVVERAAWTMIATALLSLDATITQG